LYSQWIPRGGFREGQTALDKNIIQYKSMKTEDLEYERINEKERLDDTL